MWLSIYLSVHLSGYRCPFDCSHTIQPRALKIWHNIPHVNNSRRFFFKFLKNVFSRGIALFLYFFKISLWRAITQTQMEIGMKFFLHINKQVKGKNSREIFLTGSDQIFLYACFSFRLSPRLNIDRRITKIGTNDRYHE